MENYVKMFEMFKSIFTSKLYLSKKYRYLYFIYTDHGNLIFPSLCTFIYPYKKHNR